MESRKLQRIAKTDDTLSLEITENGLITLSDGMADIFADRTVTMRFTINRNVVQLSLCQDIENGTAITIPQNGTLRIPEVVELLKVANVHFPVRYCGMFIAKQNKWRGIKQSSSRRAARAQKNEIA